MAKNQAKQEAHEVATPVEENLATPVAQQSQPPVAEPTHPPMATGEFEWRCLTCGKTAPPTEKKGPPIIEKGDFPTTGGDSSIGNP